MTIRSVTYYQAVCDKCGHVDADGDYSAWSEPDHARSTAVDDGWTELEVRVSDAERGPSIYAVTPGGPDSGNPTRKERSILLCGRHDADGIAWCAHCEDNLDERAWVFNPIDELVQLCPDHHLNTITLRKDPS